MTVLVFRFLNSDRGEVAMYICSFIRVHSLKTYLPEIVFHESISIPEVASKFRLVGGASRKYFSFFFWFSQSTDFSKSVSTGKDMPPEYDETTNNWRRRTGYCATQSVWRKWIALLKNALKIEERKLITEHRFGSRKKNTQSSRHKRDEQRAWR